MKLPSRILVGCAALLGLSLTAQPASAAYTIKLYHEFSESGAPDASEAAPYSTLVFTQNGANVDVVVSGSNMSGNNHIKGLYFNLNVSNAGWTTSPAVGNVLDLGTGNGVTVSTTSFAFNDRDNPVSEGNGFKADGDGYFDVRIDFSNSDSDDGRFQNGDSFSFTLFGAQASWVNDISQGGSKDKTGFYGAAHIGGFPGATDDSGWFNGTITNDGGAGGTPVPAPAGILLLASAIPVLGLRRVLRRKTA